MMMPAERGELKQHRVTTIFLGSAADIFHQIRGKPWVTKDGVKLSLSGLVRLILFAHQNNQAVLIKGGTVRIHQLEGENVG